MFEWEQMYLGCFQFIHSASSSISVRKSFMSDDSFWPIHLYVIICIYPHQSCMVSILGDTKNDVS
jgi:hypothetical protein